MKWKDSYYGWLIELIPLSKGYVFKCWMPNEEIGISNNHIYPSLSQAMMAARTRAKIESVKLSLFSFLNQYYEKYSLTTQEYMDLKKSVFDFTTVASQLEIQDY
ncbi:hypothetical protein H6G06_23755 [Anabaena sphaerica FACHB-251]|uniref:Uncharacterized protein n=1 Tax=Anabaena sphaerica FACHB-251 TaxID=2692883 RepID=A0A926WMD3_9NOST|nr:hypothetical protein [Anabaena sphaerica]MBD2296414.1 hypothetical protein [Anabaena sphaerica FACHB-251]